MSHGHSNHDSHGYAGSSHGSFKDYITGFILSVVLTVIAFGAVMSGAFSTPVTIGIIVVAAVVQLIVQAIYFLHLNTSSEQTWNLLTGVYTLIIVLILVLGSMWIFSHLHHNVLMGH